MNDHFTFRVRSAAVAGWWTILIAVAFLILVTAGYQTALHCRPDWMLRLWGPDITWVDFQHMCLWAIIVFRLALWLMILTAIWLSLWARRLRRAALP